MSVCKGRRVVGGRSYSGVPFCGCPIPSFRTFSTHWPKFWLRSAAEGRFHPHFFPPLIFLLLTRKNIPGEGRVVKKISPFIILTDSYLRQIHSSQRLMIRIFSDREELTIFSRNVILKASFTRSCRRMSTVTRSLDMFSLVELILVLFQRAFTSVELVKILADRLWEPSPSYFRPPKRSLGTVSSLLLRRRRSRGVIYDEAGCAASAQPAFFFGGMKERGKRADSPCSSIDHTFYTI